MEASERVMRVIFVPAQNREAESNVAADVHFSGRTAT
jgi:hypothetical protein